MNARQLQSRLSSTRAVSPPPSQAASPSPCNHQSECYSGRQSMSGSTTYISPPASKLPTSAPRSSLRPIRSNKPSRVSYPSFPPRPFPLRHSFPAPAARRNSLPQAYSHGFPNLPDSPNFPQAQKLERPPPPSMNKRFIKNWPRMPARQHQPVPLRPFRLAGPIL